LPFFICLLYFSFSSHCSFLPLFYVYFSFYSHSLPLADILILRRSVTSSASGFGGLEDACWPLVSAEIVGFFRAEKFLRRGRKAGGHMS
jgi:hypothetical protein